ncbi:MAG: hypothetical protein ACTJHW_13060 [Paenalcaligenes sp.]
MNVLGKVIAVAAMGLAGCVATAPMDEGQNTLRQDQYLRDTYRFYSSLAEIQQNLFANQRLCGSEFDWALDPYQIHYATVVYKAKPGAEIKESLLFDLTSYGTGYVEAKIYSYLPMSGKEATKALRILQDPKVCLITEG